MPGAPQPLSYTARFHGTAVSPEPSAHPRLGKGFGVIQHRSGSHPLARSSGRRRRRTCSSGSLHHNLPVCSRRGFQPDAHALDALNHDEGAGVATSLIPKQRKKMSGAQWRGERAGMVSGRGSLRPQGPRAARRSRRPRATRPTPHAIATQLPSRATHLIDYVSPPPLPSPVTRHPSPVTRGASWSACHMNQPCTRALGALGSAASVVWYDLTACSCMACSDCCRRARAGGACDA